MTKLGIISELRLNAGSYETPDWDTEADLIGDCAVNGNWNEGESTVRRTPVATAEPTTLALEITGSIRVDPTDPAYQMVRDAFLTKGVLDILALDGAIDDNTTEGYRFDGKVFDWSEDQGRGNVLFRTFNIKPCASDNIPQYVQVIGGVLAFTPIGESVGSP